MLKSDIGYEISFSIIKKFANFKFIAILGFDGVCRDHDWF